MPWPRFDTSQDEESRWTTPEGRVAASPRGVDLFGHMVEPRPDPSTPAWNENIVGDGGVETWGLLVLLSNPAS